jgi:hypothetical protein
MVYPILFRFRRHPPGMASLRMVLWHGRVRQVAGMCERLAEIAAIDPAAAGRAFDEVLASSFGGAPTILPGYFPRGTSIIGARFA